MKKTTKKALIYTAAAAFLLALAINVKVTLDDLFVMLSDEAVAQTTTTTTTTCPGGSCTFEKMMGGQVLWSCTACCIATDKPKCDVFGCVCEER